MSVGVLVWVFSVFRVLVRLLGMPSLVSGGMMYDMT